MVVEVERVLLHRDGPGEPTRDEAGGAVLRPDIVEIDEQLDLVVPGVGAGDGERVVGEVGVEQPVETRWLAGVLGRCDGEVHAHVVRAEQVGGQVDEQVAHHQGIEGAAPEGEFRPRRVPGAPPGVTALEGPGHRLGRREQFGCRPLGRLQPVSRHGALEHAPAVLLPGPALPGGQDAHAHQGNNRLPAAH